MPFYIEKFDRKMRGSSVEDALSWVDGIKSISAAEKKQIFKGIRSFIKPRPEELQK